jgi:hypothetical protein
LCTCSRSTVGHGPRKVNQENEMCLGKEMGNCPDPYSQRVISALSVVCGSLLKIMRLNTMQNSTCGKD